MLRRPYHIPPDFDSFLLIKFFKRRKWRDEFVDGKFYMNTVGRFNEYESKNKNKKQFDIYEGTQIYLRSTVETHFELIIDNEGKGLMVAKPGMQSANPTTLGAALGRKLEAEKKLFCMYTLWGDSKNKRFWKIDPSIIKEFGKYAAIVADTPLFLKRIQEEADSMKSQMNSDPLFGFVDYLHRDSLREITPIGIFRKIQEDSVLQNEFRICFDIKNVEGEYKDFRIQNSDICHPFETERLINMSAMNIEGLTFGKL